MKSCSNQLLSKARRIFHDKNDNYFGWGGIKAQWDRELDRIQKGMIRLSELTIDCVKSDSWNKMRVTFAKRVFSDKTLSDEFHHYAALMNVEDELTRIQLTLEETESGMLLSIKRANFLFDLTTKTECSSHTKSGISCLQFRAYAGVLYNKTLMNKDLKFNRLNVMQMEKRIKYILQFFGDWFDCRQSRQIDPDEHKRKMWEKSVLSTTTYYVMHLGALGYIGYCKYMLDKYPEVKYIPSLHSNTSSLEAHFSLMRWYKADTPEKYEKTVNIIDNEKSMKMLESNPMYDPQKEIYLQSISLTGDRNDERTCVISECETISNNESFIDTFDVWTNEENFKSCGWIWSELKKSVIFGSYKRHLLHYTNLRNYCKAELFSEQDKYIVYFLKSTDEVEEQCFNRVCQQVMTNLLLCADRAISPSPSNINSSFWVNVMELLSSKLCQHWLDCLPTEMSNRPFFSAVIFSLIKHFECLIDKCTIKEEHTENSKYYSTDLCYYEIQRYVGWAIFSRRKVVAKDINRLEKSKKVKVREIELLSQEATLLEFMSTCREDVKMDTDYMRACIIQMWIKHMMKADLHLFPNHLLNGQKLS